MTRQDYISHLDAMRKGVLKIIECDDTEIETMGRLSDPTPLEEERMKKTRKTLEDLADRLYEDGAVSERVRNDKIMKGELEQAEFTFPDTDKLAKAAKKAADKKGGAE